jgi:hypothetical protein
MDFAALCLTDFIDWSLMIGIFDPACELFYTLFLIRFRTKQNCFTTPNKMTSKDDIYGLVS